MSCDLRKLRRAASRHLITDNSMASGSPSYNEILKYVYNENPDTPAPKRAWKTGTAVAPQPSPLLTITTSKMNQNSGSSSVALSDAN